MNKLDSSRLLGFRIAAGSGASGAKNGFVTKPVALGSKDGISNGSALGAKNGPITKSMSFGAKNGVPSKPLVLGAKNGIVVKG
ncbi:MAG: hypothetical protein KDE32_09495 [Novosphingobium sp.]|nr:hypothetical protein [Novosphingobium sp.]